MTKIYSLLYNGRMHSREKERKKEKPKKYYQANKY